MIFLHLSVFKYMIPNGITRLISIRILVPLYTEFKLHYFLLVFESVVEPTIRHCPSLKRFLKTTHWHSLYYNGNCMQ